MARARAGLLKPQRVWGDLVEGLPQGQPEAGDQGLDHTHTWGRYDRLPKTLQWEHLEVELRGFLQVSYGFRNRLALRRRARFGIDGYETAFSGGNKDSCKKHELLWARRARESRSRRAATMPKAYFGSFHNVAAV